MKRFTKRSWHRFLSLVLAMAMMLTILPARIFAKEELEIAPPKVPIAVGDPATPKDTPTNPGANNAVHGFVGVLVGGDVNADLAAEAGQRFKPIEGVRVYFQWYEETGNRTSPVYSALSGADGQFHIGIAPYVGEDGKLVVFDADTTASAGYESYKMWVDESTIPAGYQLQYSTGENVEFTDRRVAGGGYNLIPNTLVNYRVLLLEKQDEAKMHKTATPTGPQIYNIGDVGQGAVRGKVSWDYESAGGVQWGIVSTPTSPAEGVTVTASYLSDYALKKIYSPETATMLGLRSYKDIRGSGWTFKLETQLQDWIATQVKAEKDKWIAETVSAVTNNEGDYKIQFKGTWGPERNDYSVVEGERVAGRFYAKDAHRWTAEEVNRLGTVADKATDGSFLTGAANHNEKHINTDWLFISTKDTDGLVLRTPWNYNWYTGSNNAWGIHGGWAQSAFGVSTVQPANSTRADFNLAPAEIKFNITNFDTQENTATPGDVAKTDTAGLPHKFASDSYKIIWYDKDGNKIQESKAAKPDGTGKLPESTFDTSKVKETSTFVAKLYRVDSKGNPVQALAQDAFTVKINDKIGSLYEKVEFDNEATKDAKYKATGLPNGLVIDPDTGKVSGIPTEAGKFPITVTTSLDDEAGAIALDKADEYIITDSPLKDGAVDANYDATITPMPIDGYAFENVKAKFIDTKAIDGLTINGDKITGKPTVKVDATQEDPNVEVTYDVYKLRQDGTKFLVKEGHVDRVPLSIKDGEATKYEPEYKEAEGTVGTPATVAAPTFKDKNGQAATPTGVTYELGKDAPKGAVVNADGSVTYTPTKEDAGATVTIPVVVKYSDGTSDDVDATVKVADEQNKSYEPEYTQVEGKVGEDVTIAAPKFKDGNGAETTKPDGVKFKLGTNAPEGASVDENTGVVTYKPTADKAGSTVQIPVVVTYKDGSTDQVNAPIKVGYGQNSDYTPDYKPVTAQVGHEVTVETPKYLDKDGKDANPQPTGMAYALGEGVKDGVTIDKNTGEIKYTAVDADKNTVIDVPVVVTYKDGTVDNTTAKIDVPSDANFYNPQAEPLTTEQGKVPKAEDGVKFTYTPPTDTKYEWEAQPKVNEAGETSGTVKITYPDGTTDTVEVPVKVTANAETKTMVDDSGKKPVDPNGEKQGTGIVVTNKDEGTTVTAKDKNGKTVPAEINPETGEIEVTPGPDVASPIIVTVTDSDLDGGKKDIEVPVRLKSATPVITAPKAGDDTISGTGVAGAKITLVVKGVDEDTPIAKDVVVGQDGKWTADVASGVNLVENDRIVATQTEDGKSVSDPASVRVKAADTTAPRISRISDQTVVEGKAIKDITVTTDDPKAKITVESLPKGVTYDEGSGKISGTPTVDNWGKTEETKDFSVTVNAIDEAGNKSRETFTITVQRDTDKDGIPDIYDKDDDGDGVPDDVEKENGTDPKDPNSKPDEKDTTAPKITRIGNQTVVEKQPIKEVEVKTDDPEAEITVDGLPNGVTFDKDSKKITGSPDITDWNDTDKDNPEEVRDVTVTVKAKDQAGNESEETFIITVQRDTDGDGTPDIYDKDDDGDGVPDVDEKKAGTDPKDKDSKPTDKPTITNGKAENDPAKTTTTVSGKTKPNTEVTIKTPDGKETKVTSDANGDFTAEVPKQDNGAKITVTPEGGEPSELTVTDKFGEDGKTTVDNSRPTPVDPTDKEQGTGIIIKNPDEDTKVTAKDEDGNDIPVVINPQTGEIEVIPGTNVNGPITVTVEDPDIPGGKTDIIVPVNGHENGGDDNDNEEPVNPWPYDRPDVPGIVWGGYWYLGNSSTTEEVKPIVTGRHIAFIYGYPDKSVKPEGMITRSEAAAMIARVAGIDCTDMSKPNFKDTPSDWYNGVINAMVKRNLMFAGKDGNFRPNDPITRGEFARALLYIDKKSDKIAPFADVKGHIYEDAINQAYGNGRIDGYPDGSFKPDAFIQRSEAAKILNRFDGRKVDANGLSEFTYRLNQFTDLPKSHWAYYEIIEAANNHEYYRIYKDKIDEMWSKLF